MVIIAEMKDKVLEIHTFRLGTTSLGIFIANPTTTERPSYTFPIIEVSPNKTRLYIAEIIDLKNDRFQVYCYNITSHRYFKKTSSLYQPVKIPFGKSIFSRYHIRYPLKISSNGQMLCIGLSVFDAKTLGNAGKVKFIVDELHGKYPELNAICLAAPQAGILVTGSYIMSAKNFRVLRPLPFITTISTCDRAGKFLYLFDPTAEKIAVVSLDIFLKPDNESDAGDIPEPRE